MAHGRDMKRTHIGGWPIYRNKRGWPKWYQRWLEAWWTITGKWSLHKAWQVGNDHGAACEYQRTVVNGGR